MNRPSVCGTVAFQDTRCMVAPAGEIRFGRAPDNDIRVGYAPVLDDRIPRMFGRIVEQGGRLLVANCDDRRAFDIVVAGRPSLAVEPGTWASPPDREFDITLHGVFAYLIAVAATGDGAPVTTIRPDELVGDGPPTVAQVGFSAHQRAVLAAYAAPTSSGGGPASHVEVASAFGISPAAARTECNRIWSKMLLAGVPLRDLADARAQIVDAWLRPEPGTAPR